MVHARAEHGVGKEEGSGWTRGKESGPGSCWARGERKKRERVGPSEMERTGLLGSWAGFGFPFLWVFSSFLFQTSLN